MAYVPPHLRNKHDGVASSAPRSLESLQSAGRIAKSSEPIYTLDDLSIMLKRAKYELSTLTVANVESSVASLHDTSVRSLDEDTLRAIILFEGQHPEWQTDHKILCKSNLHVLHKLAGYYEGVSSDIQSSNDTREYPLFQEIPFMKSKFEFSGWWRIENITFLAPRSPELIALFEKKFKTQSGRGSSTPFSMQRGKPKSRTEEAWRDSLSRDWAVVSLVRNHERKDRIEILPTEQQAHLGDQPSYSK